MSSIKLTRFIFIGLSVAMLSACTTAQRSLSEFMAAPTIPEVEKLPPAPAPEPLTTGAENQISHEGGVVVAIPKDLLSRKTTPAAKTTASAPASTSSPESTSSPAPTSSPASNAAAENSGLGAGFRALEGAEGCCGTGCAKACLVQ